MGHHHDRGQARNALNSALDGPSAGCRTGDRGTILIIENGPQTYAQASQPEQANRAQERVPQRSAPFEIGRHTKDPLISQILPQRFQ